MRKSKLKVLMIVAALIGLGVYDERAHAQSVAAGQGAPEGGESLFGAYRMVDVVVAMSDEDFSGLSSDTRDLAVLKDRCTDPGNFAKFPRRRADTISFDGQSVEVDWLRKKGYLGSVRRSQPSFNVKWKEEAFGSARLAFNANRQDPTRIRTCLAYAAFEKAGLPAPRCQLASVSIKTPTMAKALGVYSLVEDVEEGLLPRVFGQDAAQRGHLLEGEIDADFVSSRLGNFDYKGGGSSDPAPEEVARGKLRAVSDLVESLAGDALAEALAPHFDIEQLITFWATENLIGSWDGFSGNRNNFYVFFEGPGSRISFIPWGPDYVLNPVDSLNGGGRGRSPILRLSSELLFRLYLSPGIRGRYRAKVKELSQILIPFLQAKSAELTALVEPVETSLIATRPGASFEMMSYRSSLGTVKSFLGGRPEEVTSFVASDSISQDAPKPPTCYVDSGELSAEFDAVWGGDDTQVTPSPSSSTSLSVEGAMWTPMKTSTAAGWTTYLDGLQPSISTQVVALEYPNHPILFKTFFDPVEFAVGKFIPFDGVSTVTYVFVVTDVATSQAVRVGALYNGGIEFESGALSGGPLKAKIKGKLVTGNTDLGSIIERLAATRSSP